MLVLIMMLSIIEFEPARGQVADNVLKSFAKQYPNEFNAKWKIRNDTSIADFKMNGRKNMAYYLADGQWIKTETKIPWTKDLPTAVDNAWKNSDYTSWYVSAIKEVVYPDKNVYVMKVQQDCGPEGSIPGDCLHAYKLYYKPDGSLIKKINAGD